MTIMGGRRNIPFGLSLIRQFFLTEGDTNSSENILLKHT
jgi:hypothetical protein